jgi:predicted solute-binding protein
MERVYLCLTLLLIKKLTLNLAVKPLAAASLSLKSAQYLVLLLVRLWLHVINVLTTHDIKLARQLYQFLNQYDVLLGDCAFCSYADIIFIQNHNCDVASRLSQARKNQIERGATFAGGVLPPQSWLVDANH